MKVIPARIKKITGAQNGRHLADIVKCILMSGNFCQIHWYLLGRIDSQLVWVPKIAGCY